MGVGRVFSVQVRQVLDLLAAEGGVALALIAVAALAYVAWRTWRRRMFLRAVAMSRIDAAELKALFEGGHDLRRD